MSKGSRLLAGAATVLASLALIAAASARMVGGIGPQADNGTAYFSITHAKGGFNYAAGNISDKLFGNGASTYQFKLLPKGNGKFTVAVKNVTFYTGTGSLSGVGTITATITGTTDKLTGGKVKLDKGKGSLKGDELIATLSGTGNVTANQATFKYKGTLFH